MASKQKTVVRKYFSKRKNEWVTKTYKYNAPSPLIINKKGKVYEDKLERLRSSLSVMDQYELDRRIAHRLAMYNNYGENPRISEKTLRSMIADSKIEKAIINTGYTPEELASELGISVEDLLDEANWSESEFTFGGKTWDFEFKYDGSIMVERTKEEDNSASVQI